VGDPLPEVPARGRIKARPHRVKTIPPNFSAFSPIAFGREAQQQGSLNHRDPNPYIYMANPLKATDYELRLTILFVFPVDSPEREALKLSDLSACIQYFSFYE
jgi:hypothetical protein